MGGTLGHKRVLEPGADEVPAALRLIGRQLGNYRLLQLIGEGGMGYVYLARHSRIGRRVAIKMLRPELASDPIAVGRFFGEARAVNRINHENIVEIYDFVSADGGLTYLVLELLEGQDLLTTIDRGAPLPLARALDIMIQTAQALGAAHDAGVVHRDLKPENIFLVERAGTHDFVKLLDFGIAKLRGTGASPRLTQAGTSLGTPNYIAPEQALGADVDHRADIYSFGLILYEVMTGIRPFKSADVTETIAKQLTETPPRPCLTRSEIPARLDDLIMHCLCKRPIARPQDIVEVEHEMRAIRAMLGAPPLAAPGDEETGSAATGTVTDPAPPPGLEAADDRAGDRTPAVAVLELDAPPTLERPRTVANRSVALGAVALVALGLGGLTLRPRVDRARGGARAPAMRGALEIRGVETGLGELRRAAASVARATTGRDALARDDAPAGQMDRIARGRSAREGLGSPARSAAPDEGAPVAAAPPGEGGAVSARARPRPRPRTIDKPPSQPDRYGVIPVYDSP